MSQEKMFKVLARTKKGESVFVTGDCPELGNWNPENAQKLEASTEASNNEGQLWSKRIPLQGNAVKYRFFIGRYQMKEDGTPGVVITSWETNLSPRTSVAGSTENEESVFGTYGGATSISKGWLHKHAEVQVRFHGNPVSMRKQSHKEMTCRIKCRAIDMRSAETNPDEDDLCNDNYQNEIPVLVSVLDGTNDKPSEQPDSGVLLEKDGFISFRARTFSLEDLAFQIHLLSHDDRQPPHAVHKVIGSSHFVPRSCEGALGTRVVPVTDRSNNLIGNLSVEFLVVKPLPDLECDLSVSFARYWNTQTPSLDMGHRGMGNSHSGICASVRENTIASLSGAGNSGADYVEFDVQLSADKVPFVYHDFMACSSIRKRANEDLEYHPQQLTDLTFAQLQDLKLDHLSLMGTKNPGGVDQQEPVESRPFPTLRQCLDQVESYVGFNVEIKYPQRMKDNTMEDGVGLFPDRNSYLDVIITEVLRHAGNRRVLFSCFDADACAMIQLKQNRYPVVFLSSGPPAGYAPYMDRRSWDITSAINFAVSEELLGINPNGIDLLSDPSLVTLARQRHLAVFCWGKNNNDRENIERLKLMGVQGVIYDRVYELAKEGKVNIYKK